MTLREQKLEEALQVATEKLKEQDEILQKLCAPPGRFGTVLIVDSKKRKVVIQAGGDCLEVEMPKEPVSPGDPVRVAPTGQILAKADLTLPGPVVEVTSPGKDGTCEVMMGGTTVVMIAAPGVNPKKGDRVVVDRTGSVACRNLGQPEPPKPMALPKITWDDVGGQEEAKQALQEAVELPAKHPKLFERYGKRPARGVLLYGPPGCGKTMLAKATANAIARAHGKDTAEGFIYVKGPEILNKFVGESELTIRSLFRAAREHKARNGYPALIFIDEADAILGARGTGRLAGMETTIVPAFLAEMDGMDETAAQVLLATNRADALDSAVVRDGRIDRRVRVGRPRQRDATSIFELALKGRPATDLSELAELASRTLFSPSKLLFRLFPRGGGSTRDFTLGNIASGALVAGIAERAATRAMRREMATGKQTKIGCEDIAVAVDEAHKEALGIDHTEALAMYQEEEGFQIGHVEKARPGGEERAADAA